MLTCPPVKADKLKVFFPTRSSLVKEPNRHPGPDPSGSFLRSSLMNQPFARVNSFFRPVETFFDPLPDAPLGALSAAAKREPTRCPPPCQPLFFNFGDFFLRTATSLSPNRHRKRGAKHLSKPTPPFLSTTFYKKVRCSIFSTWFSFVQRRIWGRCRFCIPGTGRLHRGGRGRRG